MSASNNPFKAMLHEGQQLYHVSAEDRTHAARLFNRDECNAALLLPDLQKTVVAAVKRRISYLEKIAAQLEFEDHGQDFLRWDLDSKGKVIGCAPFQAFVWVGLVVLQFKKLKAGDVVFYERRGQDGCVTGSNIRYPLESVTFLKRTQA